jgi:hypothetical protein
MAGARIDRDGTEAEENVRGEHADRREGFQPAGRARCTYREARHRLTRALEAEVAHERTCGALARVQQNGRAARHADQNGAAAPILVGLCRARALPCDPCVSGLVDGSRVATVWEIQEPERSHGAENDS